MRGKKLSRGIPEIVLAIFFAAGLTAGSVGCGGQDGETSSGWPTVTEVSIAEVDAYEGGQVHLAATVESDAFPEETPVDFYFLPEGSEAGCGNPKLRVVRAFLTTPAGELGAQPSRTTFHQIFHSTTIETDPAAPSRRKLTRSALVPRAVATGTYRLAAAISGQEAGCRSDGKTFTIGEPSEADLFHTSTRLQDNSFRLPPVQPAGGKSGARPVFSVSSEIGNVGLPVGDPLEVGFALSIGGSTYPLAVGTADPQRGPETRDRYVFQPKDRSPGGPSVDRDDVRGTTFHLFLTQQAEDALKTLSEDTAGTLTLTIDPDGKVPERDKSDNTVSLPVQFLVRRVSTPPSGTSQTKPRKVGDVFDDCANGIPDSNNSEPIFCFGPNGAPATDSWSSSWIYAGYQFGGSSTDPAFLGYDGKNSVPQSARFHTASWVRVGESGCDSAGNCYEPVDALLDFWYAFPPAEVDDEIVFANFQGHLKLLGDTVFDYDNNLAIQSETDFEWFKKDKKWTLFEATVDCGGIPVHFEAGVEGEVGLGGTLSLESSEDTSFLAELSIGPFAGLSAFGEASVDLVVCEAGVGVDLEIIDLEPKFVPFIQYYAGTTAHPYPAMEMGADVPLEIKSLGGDFYAFVDTVFDDYKTTIVSWDGYDHTVDLINPLRLFIGPVGEFQQVTNGNQGNPAFPWAIWTDKPGNSYTWNGRLSLEAGTYQFNLANIQLLQIFPDDGHSGDSHNVSSCGSTSTQTFTFSQAGTYTIQATTSPQCFKSGTAQVTWAETGASKVGGLSGETGNPGGDPHSSLGTWYYNQPTEASPPNLGAPALYKIDDGVDIHVPADHSLQTDIVNTPAQGLWIQVNGQVPISPNQTRNVVFFFEGNGALDPHHPDIGSDNVFFGLGDQAGNTIRPLAEVQLDSDGKAIVPVQLPATLTSEAIFTVYYNSPDGTTIVPPPSANLRMVVAPDGDWLLQGTCVTDPTNPHSVTALTQGPSNPSAGTLGGGSVNSRNLCSSFSLWQSEYVVGAFNFATEGEYDLFAGALSVAGYTVWIDGVRVASRAIPDTGDSSTLPDANDCMDRSTGGGLLPACPVRESHNLVTLTPGYHIIETNYALVYFDPGQTDSSIVLTNLSMNRLRWDPVLPNQYMLSFYKTQQELDGALKPDPNSGAYAPVEPLLILKSDDPSQAGFNMNWQNLPGDCNSAARNQLECADSLAVLYNNCRWASATEPCGWYYLFEGKYTLADRQVYRFEGGTTRPDSTSLDFRLDGQQYGIFQAGPTNPSTQSVTLFPSGQYFGALRNASTGTRDALHDILMGVYRAGATEEGYKSGVNPPPTAALTWSQLKANTGYAVYYTSKQVTDFAGEGSFGSGETQTFCAGPGCPEVEQQVSSGGEILILASPVADPAGTYYSHGGLSLVDVIADFQITGDCAGEVTMCVNNWCMPSNVLAPATVSSSSFLPYAQASSGGGAQGLASQGSFNLAILIQTIFCRSGSVQVSLTYQAHSF